MLFLNFEFLCIVVMMLLVLYGVVMLVDMFMCSFVVCMSSLSGWCGVGCLLLSVVNRLSSLLGCF